MSCSRKLIFSFLLLVLFFFGNSQTKEIDSLQKLLHPQILDSTQAKLNYNLAWAEGDKDYEKAKEYLTRSMDLYKKLNDPKNIASCLNTFGVLNGKKGNYTEALKYFNEYTEFCKKNNFFENLGTACGNIGLVYRHLGNYSKAVEFFLESIKWHSQFKDTSRLAAVYNNIGNTYSNMGHLQQALTYQRKAFEIRKKINDHNGIYSSLSNLGNIYQELHKPDSSLYYYRESLALRKQTDDELGLAVLYDNMGTAFDMLHQSDSAKKYLDKSYAMHTKIGDAYGITSSSFSLAEFYFNAKKYSESEHLLLKNLPLVITSIQKDEEKDFYQLLARSTYFQGKYQKAIEYYYMYDTLNKRLSDLNNAQKINELQTNFEIEKRQSEIEKLEQKQTIQTLAIDKQETEIKRQRMALWLSALSAILALGFIYILFKSNRQKKEDNKELSTQKHLIEQKSKEVTDSINYAKRIQQAVLTGEDIWNKISKENFILFKPKDIVSGDFYWAHVTQNGRCIWALADCTGHGVPGGFMSMLGNSFLNEIVVENRIYSPAEILNRLREKVIKALEQKGITEQKDGMDIAICTWNKTDDTLEFAGANNGGWIMRENEFIEMKPDKMPIGSFLGEIKKFNSKQFQLQKNDLIYLSSDGYPDQFGGPKGKKLKYKQLEEILLAANTKPLKEQKEILTNKFSTWKGDLEQIDDVLIIGVRV